MENDMATRDVKQFEEITPEQWAKYQTEGYLHIEGIVSEDILTRVEQPLRRWVDATLLEWKGNGKLVDLYENLPFDQRLNAAWFAAGKPSYQRSPRRSVVSPEVFDFMRHPALIALARDLIGSQNIAAHGIFNARPKLQQQSFTNTPWHQDAQYFRESAGSNIITMWVPLVDVDENNSCLQVAPGHHRDALYDNYDDPETKFVGLSPADRAKLPGRPIPMKRGDVLCFNQMMPHAALPNFTDKVRWSMDIRFEEVDVPHSSALQRGFICSHEDPSRIETQFEHWFEQKWLNAPGAY
jgi:phytanoyl-CoA hydroxylase